MDQDEAIARLHASLIARETPETVAEIIRDALSPGQLRRVRGPLRVRLEASLKRYFGWSSMPTRFKAPDAELRQVAKARELALLFLENRLPEGDDPDEVAQLVREFNALIGKAHGRNDFKHDRLDGAARRQAGLGLSRRRYVKLFRLAVRLEQRLARLRAEEAKFRLLLVGKAALAPDLRIAQFHGHAPSAAFVAYYAARMKLRSEFTVAGQQKPFDDFAAALLALCEEDDSRAAWFAIAHVFPREDVLARLTDEEKGALLGRWFDILNETADRLEDAWRRSDIDLATMIVKRGNDSSTWNLLAGAWNRSRDHWIALASALGMDALLDEFLPGKVLRLMASDVAAWQRSIGRGVHPDTKIWAALPKPWEVLRGEQRCDRARIEAACALHGVNPHLSGWSAPRPLTTIQQFRPTPELVHGVVVNNPYLASVLRQMGAYSGRPLKTGGLSEDADG